MSGILKSKGMPPKISKELQERAVKARFVEAKTNITPLALNHSDKARNLLWKDYKHGYTNIRPVMAMPNPDWRDQKPYQNYIDSCAEEAKKTTTKQVLISILVLLKSHYKLKIMAEQNYQTYLKDFFQHKINISSTICYNKK